MASRQQPTMASLWHLLLAGQLSAVQGLRSSHWASNWQQMEPGNFSDSHSPQPPLVTHLSTAHSLPSSQSRSDLHWLGG